MNEPLDLRGVLTIGADLDLTLLDTRAATAHALREVNARCGTSIDIGAFIARLGPPIREELARWIAPEGIDDAISVYRSTFVGASLPQLTVLSGAVDLAAELRRREHPARAVWRAEGVGRREPTHPGDRAREVAAWVSLVAPQTGHATRSRSARGASGIVSSSWSRHRRE